MENSEYQIPDILLGEKSKRGFRDFLIEFLSGDSQSENARRELEQEDKFVRLLLSYEFSKHADDLAIHSALGEIRLPHIIPAQLSEAVVKRVGPLSISKGLASLYTLMCSSLYYETLDGQLNLRRARKYTERLDGLFKNHLGSLSTEGLFTNNFGSALKEYQGRSGHSLQVPTILLNILDHPSSIGEKLGRFINKVQQSKTNPPRPYKSDQ